MDDLKIQTGDGSDEASRDMANQLLGAIKAAGLISGSISAEVVKSLQAIRDEKVYLSLGCTSFDEFLDKHPDSPMSYYHFRQREDLLAKEGGLTFQLLNTLRIPAAKRKLLTSGEVNVVGDEVEINGEKFPIANSIDLRKLIVAIIEGKTEAERRESGKDKVIEKGKKEIEKRKKREAALEEQLSRGGGAVSADAAPHARALVSLLGDYQLLTQEVRSIGDADEQKRFGAVALEHLAEARLQFEAALGFQAPANTLGITADALNLID